MRFIGKRLFSLISILVGLLVGLLVASPLVHATLTDDVVGVYDGNIDNNDTN